MSFFSSFLHIFKKQSQSTLIFWHYFSSVVKNWVLTCETPFIKRNITAKTEAMSRLLIKAEQISGRPSMVAITLNHLLGIPGVTYLSIAFTLGMYNPCLRSGHIWVKISSRFLFQSIVTVKGTGGLVGTLYGCGSSLLEVFIRSRWPCLGNE